MDEFEASNGVWVKRVGAGIYVSGDAVALDRLREKLQAGSYGDITPSGQVALAEFFQAERDEELGRWRSSVDPTWTAVRRNTCIYFQNEDHERSFHFFIGNEPSIKSWGPSLQDLAREYIEAHPEPKPWEEAPVGEIWALTVDGKEVATTFRPGIAIRMDGARVEMEKVTAGRRIWPEVD